VPPALARYLKGRDPQAYRSPSWTHCPCIVISARVEQQPQTCDRTRALHMATLVATRFNPVVKAYYQHLVAVGKVKKSPSSPRCASS